MPVSRAAISISEQAGKDLAALLGTLRQLDKAARRGVRARLREVGRMVATEAKAQAEARGLRKSGELIRRIRPRVGTRSVQVIAAAMRRSPAYPAGYNYPRRHEYGQGGRRAFLRPALAEKREEAVAEFGRLLDDLRREWAKP